MVLGLSLQVGAGFAESQGHAVLRRINEERTRKGYKEDMERWEKSGPTCEDILAATKVENLAAKESREDKLINAVKNGDLESVEDLIAEGADLDLEAKDDNDMTALMIAAKKGYTDIVSRLINSGANIDAKDRYNWTALFNAVDGGHAETVKLLIANGAAKNQKDFGELFVSAVFKGNNEMVKAFLVEGARIGNDALHSAYWLARNKCSAEIVNAIKELQKKFHS